MRSPTFKEKVQLALLIGGLCLGAFVLQNAESWHAKYVLGKVNPEIISGEVTSVSLIPSNTGTSYVVGVDLETGDKAKLVGSLRSVRDCKIGKNIQIEKRGLYYNFTPERCRDD